MRWVLAYLLIAAVYAKWVDGFGGAQMELLLSFWLHSGQAPDWASDFLRMALGAPELSAGIVLAVEGVSGFLLATGFALRFGAVGCSLLYGLRYAIAPDPLALLVAVLGLAIFISDAGKSLSLARRRVPAAEPD